MNRYIDNRDLKPLDESELALDDLLFYLHPCFACTRNLIRKEDCFLTCRYIELWSLLKTKYIKTE